MKYKIILSAFLFLLIGVIKPQSKDYRITDKQIDYLMIAEGEDYSESINDTKRKFISGLYGEKYKHPYYWAPFVYYGK